MISFIKGEIEYMGTDYVVLAANNMGFNVFVSGSTLNSLRGIGTEIKLYTYLNVREDAMQLFGFSTRDELNVFKLLITVNGVGPKGALGILSVMSTDELRFAVACEDSKAISKAPGIGAKTAQKVILELKDKLKLEDAVNNSLENSISKDLVISASDIKSEAVMALTALGYSQSEAARAVRDIKPEDCSSEDASVEDIIKLALRALI